MPQRIKLHHCSRCHPALLCLACFLVSNVEGEPHLREIDTLTVPVCTTCVVPDGDREEEEGGVRKTASVLARSETAGNYVG